MATTKSPAECFEACRERISAVPEKEHAVMNMPYEEAMQEGRRVEMLVEKYGERLKASDIDAALLVSFPVMVGAFAYCVATLESSVADTGGIDNARYQELKKEAYALRRKLIAAFRYIFREIPDVLQVLAKISTGKGDLDLFKDLLSLYKLAADNMDRLKKAHFDPVEAERAYELYLALFSMSAERDIIPEKISEAKSCCMKSWTLLHDALEEIYAAGRYVFYNDPAVEELFYADYRQKIGAMTHKTEPAPETVDITAAAA
jgi:hypothetical protein